MLSDSLLSFSESFIKIGSTILKISAEKQKDRQTKSRVLAPSSTGVPHRRHGECGGAVLQEKLQVTFKES